jgi:two-component system cell cycle sensor histidine kinase/response regulator CckA
MMVRAESETRDLKRRLSEAEATIAALLSDQIDAVVDGATNTPVLLNRAQAALRESEARAQRYFDTATVMLIVMNENAVIELVNRYACSVLGWTAAELIGRDWITTCIPPATADATRKRFRTLLGAGHTVTEGAVRTKTGEERRIEWRNTVLRDDLGRVVGTLSSGIDVTERLAAAAALHRAEQRIEQSSKMEAVGQLAAGVAHDFNNLLTVIIGFTELVVADDAEAGKHHAELDEILSAAHSASALTKQLLAFSRQQVLHGAPIDVNALIVHMTGLLRRLIGEHVEIVMDLAPDLSLAFADRGQLEQVMMNLVVNARDAMPDGGKVTIATRVATLDDASFQNEAVTPGSYVMVAITDTGTGMGEETHRRLFEPFFTTKEAGKGTGLGLSTTYGIVKQSKGYIGVDTQLGAGTTFKVYLPCAGRDAPVHTESATASAAVEPASATVLLVEDEDGVRRLLRRILENAGYVVLEASDGDEAEKLFGTHMGSIDLLVTDIIMPRCGGPELYHRLQLHAPALRVLYMSGYTNQSTAQQAEIDAGLPFVQKPFTAEELEKRVRESLRR